MASTKKNMYVDDLMKSLRDVEEAKAFRVGIMKAFAEGGFDLCKWRSTHREVLLDAEEVPQPLSPEREFLAPVTESPDKVLGMRYDFSRDVFFFQPKGEKVGRPVRTKRDMLKVIAALYDPMGFIAPFIIRGRMLFQRAVQAVKGWDDRDFLPDQLLEEFASWQRKIPEVVRFRIPRWTATVETQDGTAELHVFSDASPWRVTGLWRTGGWCVRVVPCM